MAKVVKAHLERDLELLGVTGVEDKLQKDVKPSLELLRNAGIKIWMLTGDKVETARCVAVSSKLVSRSQHIHTITTLEQRLRSAPTAVSDTLSLLAANPESTALLIDGDSGVGIVGKEGRQASLAADFSITHFHHLTKLLVWHGRNSYKRSAKLAQFVMHRGLIISIAQTVFSVSARFAPRALFRDWLLVGYATAYTQVAIFGLVLDRDVDEAVANLYPELNKELTPGTTLTYRTNFTWLAVCI